MPFPNFHAARVKDPGLFKDKSFITKAITDGVTIISGKLKSGGDSLVTQTYRFAKDKYTASEAKAWLKKNKVKYISFEKAEDKNEVEDMPKKDNKNELYAKIPGSMEDKLSRIRDALSASNVVGALSTDEYLSVEATLDDSVVFYKYSNKEDKRQYYQAKWKANKDNGIEFSDVKKVDVTAVVKVKNELAARDAMVALNESTDMNETALVSFMLEKKDSAGDDSMENYIGKVTVAQEAISENGNRREYPLNVLKEAVADVQMRMQKHGPLPMETQHPRDGNNATDLRETAALIGDVQWNDNGTVTLNDIQFVDTQAGRDIFALSKALARSGAKLGVSQRALGTSELRKDESTGRVKEVVKSLYIKKWDFTGPGEQSVKKAQFDLQRLTEEQEMADKKVLTEDEVMAKLEERDKAWEERFAALKNEQKAEPKEPPKEEPPAPKETPKVDAQEPPAENKALQELQGRLNEQKEELQRLTRKDQLIQLKETGAKLINEELAKEDYKRFTAEQKKALLESVDFEAVYGKVDMSKPESVTKTLMESLHSDIAMMDKFIAAAKLQQMGYPRTGTGNGITHVEVINENIPGMEFIAKFGADVNKWMDQDNDWKLPADHVNRGTLKKILENYDRANYSQLLNEAAEDVTVSDIGIKNASISRAFIEAVWPRLTALEVCETGTMAAIQDIIPVEAWLPAFSTEVHTDVTLLQPGESQALNVAGITLSNYPILATPKNQSAMITSEARATAKGLAVDPVARTVAGLANYVRTVMDRMLWELIIAKAQSYATTEVTSWETCTRVGSTNEHYSAHEGWVKYEFVKGLDGNGNPSSAKLIPLFGTTTGNSIQEVAARESAGDNTALTYGDDYTVNWPDGTVTLTTAGAVKCAADLVDVKYSYTTNAKFWSIVPDSGVTLYSHLLNLAQSVGQAKVLVRNRYYEPNYVAMNIANEDLIGKGPQFTTSGYTQGNVKDALAMVTNYDGQPVKKSTAIPQGWIVIGRVGGAVYYVHTPWSIEGPLAIDNTRNRYWQVEEYSATDVPVTAKFSLVGVTDLNT